MSHYIFLPVFNIIFACIGRENIEPKGRHIKLSQVPIVQLNVLLLAGKDRKKEIPLASTCFLRKDQRFLSRICARFAKVKGLGEVGGCAAWLCVALSLSLSLYLCYMCEHVSDE